MSCAVLCNLCCETHAAILPALPSAGRDLKRSRESFGDVECDDEDDDGDDDAFNTQAGAVCPPDVTAAPLPAEMLDDFDNQVQSLFPDLAPTVEYTFKVSVDEEVRACVCVRPSLCTPCFCFSPHDLLPQHCLQCAGVAGYDVVKALCDTRLNAISMRRQHTSLPQFIAFVQEQLGVAFPAHMWCLTAHFRYHGAARKTRLFPIKLYANQTIATLVNDATEPMLVCRTCLCRHPA